MTRKILVLGPVLAYKSQISEISNMLDFLTSKYDLNILDPLENDILKEENYFNYWNNYLKDNKDNYECLIGFSLGGVILQKNLSCLQDKKIILFATPSFTNFDLKQKLQQVIDLNEKGNFKEANNLKTKLVFHPNPSPACINEYNSDEEMGRVRLRCGLKLVLNNNSKSDLESNNNPNLNHFIGEESSLVNMSNVVRPGAGTVYTVPNSGMRVLNDNLEYCKTVIWDILND